MTDESDLARQTIGAIPDARADILVVINADNTTDVAYRPDHRQVAARFSDPHVAMMRSLDWNKALDHVCLFQKWAARLDASFGPVFDMFKTPPQPFDATNIAAALQSAVDLFNAFLRETPGTPAEKFEQLGSPPLLAYGLGQARAPLTSHEHAMELHFEKHGRPDDGATSDGRRKPIVEPATGKRWSCAKDLARDLGCAPGTVYAHMSRPHIQPAIRGRVFQYAEPENDPNNILAKSPEEQARIRADMAARGFQPRF